MNLFKRIVALSLAFVMCFSVISAKAADGEYSSKERASFWDWYMSWGMDFVKDIPYFGSLLQRRFASTSNDLCPYSEDHYHHGKLTGEMHGNVYLASCEHCGDTFRVSPDDVLAEAQSAYDSYVDELPLNGIDNEGGLLWYPTWNDLAEGIKLGADTPYNSMKAFSVDEFLSLSNYDISSHWYQDPQDCFLNVVSNRSFTVLNISTKSDSYPKGIYLNYLYGIYYPLSGTYERLELPHISLSPGTVTYYSSSTVESNAGGLYGLRFSSTYPYGFSASNDSKATSVLLQFWLPAFRVTPSADLTDDQWKMYEVNSRTGSITGGLGIIGDNGTLYQVENNYIFNEENNTFYNPQTGTYETVSSWTYDYSDRSYHLTLENGDTITVTFGDQNITITQGDTIYNVYYIIDGSGGGTDNPGTGGTHQHNYTSRVTREPTCTVPGVRTYTCSECVNTYTEAIPAPGHNWEVKTSVATEYDDEGNLVQEGYTIYKCSVCGEEYKTGYGTSPPSSGSSDSSSSTSGVFSGIFGLFGIWCPLSLACSKILLLAVSEAF